MNKYKTININDMLMELGEEKTSMILSAFSCPQNTSIEEFIHKNAIPFAKQGLSITYLVFTKEKHYLAGIFSLAHKTMSVDIKEMSRTKAKRITRFATYDPKSEKYNISSFLIAQFGKNKSIPSESAIAGNDLMDLAMKVLKEMQYKIGGKIVYLDCEDIDKVLAFYQNNQNRFTVFAERVSKTDGKRYKQLMKFF